MVISLSITPIPNTFLSHKISDHSNLQKTSPSVKNEHPLIRTRTVCNLGGKLCYPLDAVSWEGLGVLGKGIVQKQGQMGIPSMASEKAMAPHSSTLAWKIPWMEEPGRLRSMRSLRVGHDWATSLSLLTFTHWRRKWQPTPVFFWRIQRTGEPGGLPSTGSQSRTRLKWLSSSSSSIV